MMPPNGMPPQGPPMPPLGVPGPMPMPQGGPMPPQGAMPPQGGPQAPPMDPRIMQLVMMMLQGQGGMPQQGGPMVPQGDVTSAYRAAGGSMNMPSVRQG